MLKKNLLPKNVFLEYQQVRKQQNWQLALFSHQQACLLMLTPPKLPLQLILL
jgi:hypothetical protein